MANFEDLDHLAAMVRATLPDRKALTQLEAVTAFGYVLAAWSGHKFVVKLTGESFELKGTTLHLTAASLLLTNALMTRARLGSILAAVTESLGQVEGLIGNDTKKALELLTSTKAPIRRLLVEQPKPQ